MYGNEPLLTFGPVPSRRLGRSLGINNIPPKTCSYSCIYCQLGRTDTFAADRSEFYQAEHIVDAVKKRVRQCRDAGEAIDYLTFVPDGEPTLDVNLSSEVDLLGPLGIPLAIITNASMLWLDDVRGDLNKFDFVSVKVDAADETTWRKINRPHQKIDFERVRDGLVRFAAGFKGELATETMLVRGVNDSPDQLQNLAQLAGSLNPSVAYLAVPIRPPAETWAVPPDSTSLLNAFETFNRRVRKVEYLTGYEGNEFASTGDTAQDLLSITAVHPMRDDAVAELLSRHGADEELLRRLLSEGELIESEFGGHKFYLRKFARHSSQPGCEPNTC